MGEASRNGFGKNDRSGYHRGSYKDRLVGSIPGAYEQAFGFETSMEEDIESDEEEEVLC